MVEFPFVNSNMNTNTIITATILAVSVVYTASPHGVRQRHQALMNIRTRTNPHMIQTSASSTTSSVCVKIAYDSRVSLFVRAHWHKNAFHLIIVTWHPDSPSSSITGKLTGWPSTLYYPPLLENNRDYHDGNVVCVSGNKSSALLVLALTNFEN